MSIECQAHGEAVVTLNEVPAEPPSQRAQLKLNVSAEDHGRSFSCSAALTVAGHVLYKNQTQVLSVLCKWGLWTMTPNLQGPPLPHPLPRFLPKPSGPRW